MGSRGGYRQSPQGLRIKHVVVRKSRLRFLGIIVNLRVSEYRRFDGPLLSGKTRNSDPKNGTGRRRARLHDWYRGRGHCSIPIC